MGSAAILVLTDEVLDDVLAELLLHVEDVVGHIELLRDALGVKHVLHGAARAVVA